ncbi:S8 family serine peptidase [Pedobacter sp. WC2423]|uniref:S8 family serine peptidase n=1 Tax=Pedobacter sp. WC2423 TaxID=3234142 RepID=UPI003465E5F0
MTEKICIKCLSMLRLIIYIVLSSNFVVAQTRERPKDNWQNLDLKADSVFGISTEKAYLELLKDKKAISVIIAVIDGGVDINHEDLKSIIWTNPKEIPGNGKDDDQNGFIDDIHGWDFRSNIIKENEKAELLSTDNKLKIVIGEQKILDQIIQKIGKAVPAIDDFKNYVPNNEREFKMQMNIVSGLKSYPDFLIYKKINLQRAINYYKMQLAYYEKKDYDLLTGGASAYHGTHVSGIIAAVRTNNIGIKGVADHVKIMVLKAIPGINPIQKESTLMVVNQFDNSDADKKTKGIATAIRYATDNGAKIINMSFGQPWAKKSVEVNEAIKYAISKDILIVHGAGNEGVDLDQMSIYPDRNTKEGQAIAECWLEVGASDWRNNEKLAAPFSNFGKKSVDVYAPGVDITSTIPRSAYLEDTGTSMATPMVSGLAGLIRAYYPKLTAAQVKNIIMKSVLISAALKDKCISGGIINTFSAFSVINLN